MFAFNSPTDFLLNIIFLQSRGKGAKPKKKYKRSAGGSLSDSSGSVIRQVSLKKNILTACFIS